MTDAVVSFAALRTARMLRQNAPRQRIDDFVACMTMVAREQCDGGREAFWREVARLTAGAEPALTVVLGGAGGD